MLLVKEYRKIYVINTIYLVIYHPSLQLIEVGADFNPWGGPKLRSYQSVLILKPDYDETQVQQNTESISDLIKAQGGSCLKIDNWGKKRLAYKVKKNRFGIYLNIYHNQWTESLVEPAEVTPWRHTCCGTSWTQVLREMGW